MPHKIEGQYVSAGDIRARKLLLNPRPRQTNRKCHITIPPAAQLDEYDLMIIDRIYGYINNNKTKRER